MGILNITPDSFYDGGRLFRDGRPYLPEVLRRAERMVAEGADVLDVGGESTRPGAERVTAQQEVDRVVPVVEAVASRFDVVVSVDTSSGAVIAEAAGVGAGLVNDVRALRASEALSAVINCGLPVCLMHMQGEPGTMQRAPRYDDVVGEVYRFLLDRVDTCVQAGLSRDQVLIDPGFGFGKSLRHNLSLIRNLSLFTEAGYPLVVGVSRKSMIGAVTGRDLPDRLSGSLALAAMAVERGAAMLRVHDVAETRDVVAMVNAVLRKE